MESNSVCNYTNDWQNWTAVKRESNLSITCMINCYQLIITNAISEKKIQLGQTSPVGTMSKAKNLEISQFFLFQGKWFLQMLLWSISSNHIWGNCNGYA